MKNILEFYYFKNKDVYIPETIKNVFIEYGIWNKAIEKCILSVGEFAHDLATNKEAKVDKIYYKNINVISELINRYYYNGIPKVVNESVFEKLSKSKTIYYRGVNQAKYVDDVKYKNTFSGTNNIVQGTWISTDKDYALGYANNDIINLIECILNSDAKIYDRHTSSVKFDTNELHTKLDAITKSLDYTEFEYRYTRFLIKYINEYILYNNNFILAINGYDVYRESDKVMVVLNKTKLIIKK